MKLGALGPMGWLQLVGSIKLKVSFVKEPYKRDDILQKRPIILSSLLIVATPYEYTSLLNMYISPMYIYIYVEYVYLHIHTYTRIQI